MNEIFTAIVLFQELNLHSLIIGLSHSDGRSDIGILRRQKVVWIYHYVPGIAFGATLLQPRGRWFICWAIWLVIPYATTTWRSACGYAFSIRWHLECLFRFLIHIL